MIGIINYEKVIFIVLFYYECPIGRERVEVVEADVITE